MPLGMEVGLGPDHIVLDGATAPLREHNPQFSACLLWPNGGWIKTPLGRDVGIGQSHIVLDGDPAPLPSKRRGTVPNFRPMHICCDQTSGWIKMSLGTDVGLSPGDIMLDG